MERSVNVHQGLLVQYLRRIFPQDKLHENTRKLTQFKYTPESSYYLELDVWFPKLNICFEFQDEHHYRTTWYHQNSAVEVQRKDNIKRQSVLKLGIEMIAIPCWWDGSIESLRSSIHFQCPHLTSRGKSPPISLTPPSEFFPSRSMLPGVGELMSVSFPMETKEIFQKSWWMGEKYDGIRFCWNSHERRLYSRVGKRLFLLPQLIALIPPIMHMEGELWFGRGQFALAFLLAVKQLGTWDLLRVIAFDVPTRSTQKRPYESRYRLLVPHVIDNLVMLAPRMLWHKKIPLNSLLQRIIEDGGEGVILQQIGSQYINGRSQEVIKLKSAYADKEGIVVRVRPHSIQLQLPNGSKFIVPIEDVYITNLKIGDVVSFSYESQARRNRPVNPKIYRLRSDLLWDDVINLYNSDEKYVNVNSHLTGVTVDPTTFHWTRKKMRLFLLEFANNKNLEPLSAETWYSIKGSDLKRDVRGRAILDKFNGYAKALESLLPEIAIDRSLLKEPEWDTSIKRRKLFETYAAENYFDPLIPRNWYSQLAKKIMSFKDLKGVVAYHGGRLVQALLDLFSEIGLEGRKLAASIAKAWRDPKNRRAFFENYARERKFDPIDPVNWYRVSGKQIEAAEAAKQVLQHHYGEYKEALCDLFPEIGLKKVKFWASRQSRREFLENYARANKFDPLVASNWNAQSTKHIRSVPWATRVLSYHNKSISQALLDLFPEISVELSSFFASSPIDHSPSEDPWSDPKKRRAFFEDYAKEHQFDPLNPLNWYVLSRKDFDTVKGTSQVMRYHGGFKSALRDLFPDIGLNKSYFWPSWQCRRMLFENYANSNNFDPLIPGNWFTQSKKKLLGMPWATNVLRHHNNDLSQALRDLFPEIVLAQHNSVNHAEMESPTDKLGDPKARRAFFEDFARIHRINPLNPNHWYLVSRKDVEDLPGANMVLSYHSDGFKTALCELFPEIGLVKSNFYPAWQSRRGFFEEYAKANAFDPLLPTNWYAQPRKKILSSSWATRVLSLYNDNLLQALLDVFPEMRLTLNPWESAHNRRGFFEGFAKSRGLDPLDPLSWYKLSKAHILSEKGAALIVKYHNNQLTTALMDLFPEIGLKRDKFRGKMLWENQDKRKFFEDYAKENGFNPYSPQHWYTLRGKIVETNGVVRKVSPELVKLFPEIGLEKAKLN